MSRHPRIPAGHCAASSTDRPLTARELGRALLRLAQRHPALTGTLLVAGGYGLMKFGWRELGEAALIYFLGAHVLAAIYRRSTRSGWLAAAWNLAFVADIGVKAFMIAVYKSKPDTPLVIEAISNTTSGESAEFLMNYWQLLGSYTLQLLVLAVLLFIATRPAPGHTSSSGRRALAIVAILFALLHLDPTLRRANPLIYWSAQAATVEEFRANMETLRAKRELARSRLPDWQATYDGPAQNTIGLVIGESTNRWNWHLYGYPRQTTPELQRRADELLVFRDVLSAASTTVSALRHMLTPRSLHADLKDEEQPSVLMLAKAAGYKVFWISNQHDRYITTRFAEEADVVRLLNTGVVGPERSLDEQVIPEWKRALEDPAPRKLIVVHLIGAHAHYDLRSPDAFKHFENLHDDVDRQLEQRGRPLWVRAKRNQYDDAMRYQDWVLSRLLDDFRASVGESPGAWLYTSDHGEEVGHTRDFTGHSPDEPGQVVPLLVWTAHSRKAGRNSAIEDRPFQTDVLDWTLLDLLHVRTRRDQPQDRLLADSFQLRERRLHDGSIYRPATSQIAQAIGPQSD